MVNVVVLSFSGCEHAFSQFQKKKLKLYKKSTSHQLASFDLIFCVCVHLQMCLVLRVSILRDSPWHLYCFVYNIVIKCSHLFCLRNVPAS